MSLFFGPRIANAQNNAPQANNRFGIHIIDEHDLEDAARLVNSSGGEWGYVTVVIREDERDINRWTNVFRKMSELKLIPIIRLATTMQPEGNWAKPSKDQAIPWVDFLNSLPWPTAERYVVLFNEPNHAKEWGGEITPEEYAGVSRHFWEEFKKANPDFSILPAALDLAAPNGKETMNATNYFERMFKADEFIFTIFDAWNSHSYPNPGFSGSPFDTGKMSIRGFEWELKHLSNYHLPSTTPVFITETGWKNSERSGDYYKVAFEQIWTHPNIRAVTPFLLNYRQPPFDNFSWRDPVTNAFRPQYEAIQLIPKTAGSPGV
jgi:hypothetical protein